MMTRAGQIKAIVVTSALVSAVVPAYALRQVQQGNVVFVDQELVWNGPVIVDPSGNNMATLPGFNVAASGTQFNETPAAEALKLIEAGEWVQAIQTIESMDATDARMIVDNRGILRPLWSLKSSLLASLPEEGRRAFRKLNDPAARTRLEEARGQTELSQRSRALQAVILNYALCDASATAADELGDIRFEQGRFDEAADLYRFCAEHPGTGDNALLMAKRLLALSRADQWQRFDDLVQYAQFRYPDTTIQLGGQAVAIRSLIEQLNESRGNQPTDPATALDTTIAMPEMQTPVFDQWLIDAQMQRRTRDVPQDRIMPVVIADHQRVFSLALGSVARLDPATGRDVWRTGDPSLHASNINLQQMIAQGSYHQALVLTGEKLIAIVPDQHFTQRSNGNTQSNLVAMNADTGQVLWDLGQTGESLSHQSAIGRPLVVGNLIYLVTQQPNNPQLNLSAIRLSDGKVQKTLELGKIAQNPNSSNTFATSPRLVMGQDYLFVQTHSGALIAVEPSDLQIAWAFTPPTIMEQNPTQGRRRMPRGVIPQNDSLDVGELIAREGIVISKDAQTNAVYAFREYDAAPLWTYSTNNDDKIVHADARHVYVLGDELTAIDLKSGEPVWWTPHAGANTGRPIFTADACLIAGTGGLCRFDLTTGRLTNISDAGVGQADLMRVGNQVIMSTNDSVMGYRLPATPQR